MAIKAKRLLLAAGGTGGHMFPAQALAETLRARDWDIAMITDGRGLTHAGRIPADPILEVEAASLSPRQPLQAVKGVMKLWRGTRQAKHFISTWKPDIVAGFGGYPAFPALRAAQSMNVPILLHEQNAVLGRVNRVFARKARCVATGFEDLSRCPNGAQTVYVGNPLRLNIIEAIPPTYQLPKDDIHILIVGGSLGARIISDVMPAAIARLGIEFRARLVVTQQTRAEQLSAARDMYAQAGIRAVCEPFFDTIETHLARAHYVVGRAGASSVSEIAAMGKPSLLIPLAIAMDDHQTRNATALKNRDAADILPESDFTPDRVKDILEARLHEYTWLENAAASARKLARPDAATRLADVVESLVQSPSEIRRA